MEESSHKILKQNISLIFQKYFRGGTILLELLMPVHVAISESLRYLAIKIL